MMNNHEQIVQAVSDLLETLYECDTDDDIFELADALRSHAPTGDVYLAPFLYPLDIN